VIRPLFDTYSQIEDETLTQRLSRILAREGLKSSGFFKQDTSRRTNKENAFLAGLGRTRRVVLADNLIEHMNTAEIESIIAHEVGHYRHFHVWKGLASGSIQQVLLFFSLHLLMRSLLPEFPASFRTNLAMMPGMVIFMGALSLVLFQPLNNAASRRWEKKADAYALKSIADKRAFQTALAGLADRNLIDAYPARWIHWLFYSHPPIGERLRSADRFVRLHRGPDQDRLPAFHDGPRSDSRS
jgi:STE24 endopeptidase